MKKMFALSLILLLLLLPASTLAQGQVGQRGPSTATGRLGGVNPNHPVFIIRPVPALPGELPVPGGHFVVVPPGTPGSRATIPFSDEPHPLNNAHPMLPNAGLGYAMQYIQVPTQQIVLPVYVPGPGSFSGGFESRAVEIPGYVIVETTTGYIYPARWGVQQVTIGVYQWVVLPQTFQPK